MSRNNFLCYW